VMALTSILSNTVSPFEDPKTWDTIIVAGESWVGKVEISGAERAYDWQVKSAAGIEGAQETYRGKKPTKFEIAFYIWTREQYAQWLDFSKAFLYAGTKKDVKPVTIQHPALANLSITEVVCEALGAVEKVSDDLMFRARVKLREYFPPLPKNATRSPTGAVATSPNVPGVKTNPVIDRLQAQIQEQYNTAVQNGLLGGLPQ
jgi:hypothetical protein